MTPDLVTLEEEDIAVSRSRKPYREPLIGLILPCVGGGD